MFRFLDLPKFAGALVSVRGLSELSRRLIPSGALLLVTLLSGCANQPTPPLALDLPGAVNSTPSPNAYAPPVTTNTLTRSTSLDALPHAKPTIYRGDDLMVRQPKERVAQTTQDKNTGKVALNFEQVPVTDLVQAILGKLLKVDYSIDAPLKGEVTLHTAEPVPEDRLLTILESFLLANGALMVKGNDGIYHIGPAETIRGLSPGLVNQQRIPDGYNTVIFPLHYIAAKQMAEILKPLAPAQAFIRVDDSRNLLMLAGTGEQLRDWQRIIESFDVDMLKGMSVGVFPIEYGSVKEIASAVNVLLGQAQKPAGQTDSAGNGLVKVLPLERLNSLLVITPRAHYLDSVKTWISRLDKPAENSLEPTLYVYPVQNGSAIHLAKLLNDIYSGNQATGSEGIADSGVAPGLATSTISNSAQGGVNNAATSANPLVNNSGIGSSAGNVGSGSGGINTALLNPAAGAQSSAQPNIQPVTLKTDSGGQIRVVADNQNNALLIYAKRQDYEKIANALRRLDVQPVQVLIEASIVEVTLTGSLQYGLEWYLQGSLGSGLQGAAGLNFNTTGAINPVQPGFSYSITNGAGVVRAVLSALAQKSLLKVISSPSVMVLNNHTATIQVGDQQPIQSAQTIVSNGIVSNSITYKDTGVILQVTPSVNAGDMVTLRINQAVTDVGGVDSATGQRSFLQRQVDTKVEVHSGQTVTLGGLIKSNESSGKSGLPFLSDIPGLGNLFSTTSKSDNRTELLVLITPRVLRNQQDLSGITQEMQQRMQSVDMLYRQSSLGDKSGAVSK